MRHQGESTAGIGILSKHHSSSSSSDSPIKRADRYRTFRLRRYSAESGSAVTPREKKKGEIMKTMPTYETGKSWSPT
jgi:hypothetical protein